MSLAKCVAMGTFDNPSSPGSPYADLRYPGAQGLFTDSRTGWVRLFAEWNYWEPGAISDTTSPSYLNQQAATDANIIIARTLGLRVILCTRSFPTFANGSTTDEFVFPSAENLAADSPYAAWIHYLMDRYHPVNRFILPTLGAAPGTDPHYRWIDFFEVVNEPNSECHPADVAPARTAAMFSTAHGVANYLNVNKRQYDLSTGPRPLRLLGPGTSDSSRSDADHAPYDTFTADLLAELGANSFPLTSAIFGWSHHNYTDVANQMPLSPATSADPTDGNRAQLVRSLLTGIWAGYPSQSVADPHIYLTEGGYHRATGTPTTDAAQDAIQASSLAQAISALTGNTGPGEPGDGIELFTNLFFDTNSFFDSGLCRQASDPLYPSGPGKGTRRRPAYFVWTSLQ
jgi:hypothetical protein